MRFWRRVWPAAVVVLLWGCGGTKPPAEDPTTAAMKQAVTNSAARVTVVGRTDWEAVSDRGEFWVRIRLKNSGGAGKVAVRAALKTSTQYVGTGTFPTEPTYIDMAPDEETDLRLTGKVPENQVDRAMGVLVEAYPYATNTPQPMTTG